jgi:hypothetical protein
MIGTPRRSNISSMRNLTSHRISTPTRSLLCPKISLLVRAFYDLALGCTCNDVFDTLLNYDEAPSLFTEGFYRYSVLASSLDVSNHHPNLLAQWFIFYLRDHLEPLRVLAV